MPYSVVMPCYNARRYLEEAVDSVLGQSVPPSSVIVVDDGSTDGGIELLPRHPVIQVIRQENAGASVARNAGLALARTPVVVFADSDDVLPHDSVESRLRLLDDDTVHAAAGKVEHFLCPDFANAPSFVDVPPTQPVRLPGALAVRRDVFDQIGGFDPASRMGEAMEWFARFDAAGLRCAFTDHVVLRRRLHANNSTRDRGAMQREYLSVLRKAVQLRRNADGPLS